MNALKKNLLIALPYTLPVLTGYLFVGLAFGIYLGGMGFQWIYAGIMGIVIFAGSMQFVTIDLIVTGASLISAFFMTLMVNARHLFYGLSMLERLKTYGKKKTYMIYSLTDEMFSLLVGTKVPEGVKEENFFFYIALLCQSYWVLGSVLGALLGTIIKFNMTGIDFVMTALFTVIFLDQWESTKEHIPALVGVGISLLSLVLFGTKVFILPAMVAIVLLLTTMRKSYEAKEAAYYEK